METRRWTNPSQPQTLQIAVFLLYASAVLAFLGRGGLFFLAAVAGAIGGYGIANDRRWGYRLAVAASSVEVALLVVVPLLVVGLGLVFNLWFLLQAVFPVALFALLLHPESREHQRIWFD